MIILNVLVQPILHGDVHDIFISPDSDSLKYLEALRRRNTFFKFPFSTSCSLYFSNFLASFTVIRNHTPNLNSHPRTFPLDLRRLRYNMWSIFVLMLYLFPHIQRFLSINTFSTSYISIVTVKIINYFYWFPCFLFIFPPFN